MSLQSRKQKIIQIVNDLGEQNVAELAHKTETSEATIRRDLMQLDQAGLLIRTHGGAMSLQLMQKPVSFEQKAVKNLAGKNQIAYLAAQQIADNTSVFLDCGSTVFRMCQYLKHRHIKVITNSLPIVTELLGTAVQLNFVGGEVDPQRQATHGFMAMEHLQKYKVDQAFLGVDGLSANGLSANSEKEIEITATMMRQAKQFFILCDTTKIGQDAHIKFAELSTIQCLITDADDVVVGDYKLLINRVLN